MSIGVLTPWELDLRWKLKPEWQYTRHDFLNAVKVTMANSNRIQRNGLYAGGRVQPILLNLEHLKFMDNGSLVPTARDPTKPNSAIAFLRNPGTYRCSSEGTVGESCVFVVVVNKLGSLNTAEDLPVFYDGEDAALVALSLPLLRGGDDSRQDLAVSLQVEGPSGLPRARVVLADDRSRAKNLPSLTGSFKQIAWASVLRDELVAKIRDAEKSRGSVERRMERFLSPVWVGSSGHSEEDFETLTFAELHAELQHAVDAEVWLQGRFTLPFWLACRALDRRKHPLGQHPF